MKKAIICALVVAMVLTGCQMPATNSVNNVSSNKSTSLVSSQTVESGDDQKKAVVLDEPEIDDLMGEEGQQYIKDIVYSGLEESLDNENYVVELETIPLEEEYLIAKEYNSRENVYFGHTKSELDAMFQGEKYIFTLGDDGTTKVEKLEDHLYDDTYDRLLKNIVIGAGVILVCATISVVSAGVGAPAVSAVFAVSAKSAATFGLSGAAISGSIKAAMVGWETGDLEAALKEGALEASEGFKIGAIIGAAAGGLGEIASQARGIPSARESELRALKEFPGEEQASFMNGEMVPGNPTGSTRPDIVRTLKNNKLEAVEVKNYDLASKQCVDSLCVKVKKQVADRIVHMPEDTTQRIVLDVKNRHFSKEIINNAIERVQSSCADIYPNLPVSVIA